MFPIAAAPRGVTAVLGDQIPLASVDLTVGPRAHQGRHSHRARRHQRSAAPRLAPEIPTIAEGGVPGFDGSPGFIGLFAPAGTPPAVIRQLSQEIAAIVARPDVQAKIAAALGRAGL